MKYSVLDKVATNNHRPTWSVMIPVYNAAGFLKETLQSVVQQALSENEMEIIVVDDCSTDNPEEVVNEIGKGRVQYFRQPKNLGHTGNFKTCLQLSKGKYIHLLHGDDIVYDGYYKTFTHFFINHPTVMAAFCRCHFINEESKITNTTTSYMNNTGLFSNFFSQICRAQIIQTPSIVVKREVYETIGIFNETLSWSEDWEMWARVGRHYDVGFINEVLAGYRIHNSSNSGQYVLSGENIKDLKRAIQIINSYIEDEDERKLSKKTSGAYYSKYAMDMATHLSSLNKNRGARNQLKYAFFMNDSPRLKLAIAKQYLKTFF